MYQLEILLAKERTVFGINRLRNKVNKVNNRLFFAHLQILNYFKTSITYKTDNCNFNLIDRKTKLHETTID